MYFIAYYTQFITIHGMAIFSWGVQKNRTHPFNLSNSIQEPTYSNLMIQPAGLFSQSSAPWALYN